MAGRLGLDERVVLMLWTTPRDHPHDSDELTAIERWADENRRNNRG